jgi:hypothetical protein
MGVKIFFRVSILMVGFFCANAMGEAPRPEAEVSTDKPVRKVASIPEEVKIDSRILDVDSGGVLTSSDGNIIRIIDKTQGKTVLCYGILSGFKDGGASIHCLRVD